MKPDQDKTPEREVKLLCDSCDEELIEELYITVHRDRYCEDCITPELKQLLLEELENRLPETYLEEKIYEKS